MKRFILLLGILFVLAGCTAQPAEPVESPTDPTEQVQETTPWVEELGMEWDDEGILKEVPLTIPDGLHYSAAVEFDGDLLLWSVDDHRLNRNVLEMALVELDDGSVTVQRDLEVVGYVYPRCLGDSLYICDGTAGLITVLDKNLETIRCWEIEPTEQTIIMGAGDILYWETEDSRMMRQDLNTGKIAPLLEEDPIIAWFTESENDLVICYYLEETGLEAYCSVDLFTGEITRAEGSSRVDSATRVGSMWLREKYAENYIYYLCGDDGTEYRIVPEDGMLKLTEDGHILGNTMDSTVLSLYDLKGKLISSARVSDHEVGYPSNFLIWNEVNGGYFFLLRSYNDTARVLFWDPERTLEGKDLTLEPVPQPSEAQQKLEARAKELSEKFGVVILVGDQCDTVFDDFTATLATDYDQVDTALNVLERAMDSYPDSFIRQLRYGEVQNIRVHLVADLQATGSGRTGGGYNAFTQTKWDHALMVIDIEDSGVQTYYHEFSHLIDRYLEWDAEQRTDALYFEGGWTGLNPAWFDGYTYDYGSEQYLYRNDAFIDGYATINPTEDRARVLEYAMADSGNYHFDKGTVLYEKLDYYSRCIRDAFDTSDWTEAPLWEQFL